MIHFRNDSFLEVIIFRSDQFLEVIGFEVIISYNNLFYSFSCCITVAIFSSQAGFSSTVCLQKQIRNKKNGVGVIEGVIRRQRSIGLRMELESLELSQT